MPSFSLMEWVFTDKHGIYQNNPYDNSLELETSVYTQFQLNTDANGYI